MLDAILADPDDDARRLVWADAVGGRRGELVVVQCDLARGGLSLRDRVARRRRERELLKFYRDDLSGLWGIAHAVDFRRGFVEAVWIDPEIFARRNDLFQIAPLLHSLTIRGHARLFGLLQTPAFSRIERFAVIGADEGDGTSGDVVLTLLAQSPHLEHLTGISIEYGGATASGVHSLIASRRITQLDTIWIDEGQLGNDALLALIDQCPHLRSLALEASGQFDEIAARLPALDEVKLFNATERVLEQLAVSRAGASLRRLHLLGGAFERGCAALGDLRQLETLVMSGRDVNCEAFARLAHPCLRRLRLGALTTAEVTMVAEGIGSQLEELLVPLDERRCAQLAKYAPGVAQAGVQMTFV